MYIELNKNLGPSNSGALCSLHPWHMWPPGPEDMNEVQLEWWKETSAEITARRRAARQEATAATDAALGGGADAAPGGGADAAPAGGADGADGGPTSV
jgi:hypothetical protein